MADQNNSPNVAGMVTDQRFLGLSPSDKRAALVGLTGDQRFNQISDADMTQFVASFHAKSPREQMAAQIEANPPKVPSAIPPLGKMPFTRSDETQALFANADKTGKVAAFALLPEAAATGTAGMPLLVRSLAQAVAGGGAAAINGGSPGQIAGAAALAGAAPGVINAIPRISRAGEAFSQVAKVANPLAVDANPAGQVVMEAQKLQAAGQTMPRVMQKFIQRVTDPNQGPLSFEEARNFLSTAGRLSAQDQMRLTPQMGRQLATFVDALGRSTAETAARAGQGEQYANAINEYRQAAQLVRGLKAAGKYGAIAGASAVGAGTLGKVIANHVVGK